MKVVLSDGPIIPAIELLISVCEEDDLACSCVIAVEP
jgi:hypothetical protein